MTNCVQCGSRIPDGQRTCSMCYGDIAHGRDGYYREWAERREREKAALDELVELNQDLGLYKEPK